uniref:Secreted protein n=1 Tax=Ditylenchus dipsaci TaxID=166011 RepID=A0A915ETH8_9BILA
MISILFLLSTNVLYTAGQAEKTKEKVCRHGDPPVNFGLGHGCELAITVLCNLHCTSGALKNKDMLVDSANFLILIAHVYVEKN